MSIDNRESRGTGRRIFWRSLEHKAERERFATEAKGSDIVKQTIDAGDLLRLNRRKFMTLGSAMGALAGLEGCIRRPAEKILPYVSQPEYASPGAPLHYATVTDRRGEALGLLVTANDGRPTKVEGNPEHPASLGSTDMYAQASVLDLYDADRAQVPTEGGTKRGWEEVDAMLAGLTGNGGRGLAVLMEPTNSPTVLATRAEVQRRLPNANFYVYSPMARPNVRDGGRAAFGKSVQVVPDFSKAKTVVALDSDFMLTEVGAVRAARDFATARNMDSAADEINRLYVVEPSLSVTGTNADHRLRLAGSQVGMFANALSAELRAKGFGSLGAVVPAPEGVEAATWKRWVSVVADELIKNKGASVVVVGERQPAAVHALAHAMNEALGNVGSTVAYHAPVDADEPDQLQSIKALTDALRGGSVKNLVILGGNPVYDAPADVNFAEAVAKAAFSVHFASHVNETGAATTWQVPRAHELETWGDQLSIAGDYSVQQPLVAPLWYGRSDIEVLGALAGDPLADGYKLVHGTAERRGHVGEYAWRTLLHGGIEKSTQAPEALKVDTGRISLLLQNLQAPAPAAGAFELAFQIDTKMLDGRYANNSWLLELPDPITRITWDNVALIAPATAKDLGIENGDMVRIAVGDSAIEIAAWRQPGQAPYSIGLNLGWGRTKVGSGGYGYSSDAEDIERRGFDVYPLRTTSAFSYAAGATIEKLGRNYPLSQTQDHDMMRDPTVEEEDRPLAVDATLSEYKEKPDFGQWASPDPSVGPLWETVDYSKGYQWGMTVDLNLCNGCNACVVACQAENNVPTVGKDQVARGREMHWFRIDRYYVGEDEDSPEVSYQPIGCQHCEEAPCENVCPVMATAHSDEGLNDIAYNRCIGTRYCMNNCPYKVRRFNFLAFNKDIPETIQMQRNPQVSNRFRGVIEKCSYCVQRVQNAKIAARREDRMLKDGDVVSACQQACPTKAIAFGDINDPESEVSKKRAVDRAYGLLAEIGARPRTRFLGKVRNPNPEMKA